MSERKAINKYYPPDFDPSKVKKAKVKKNADGTAAWTTVRLMTPFSLRCTKCDEYIAKRKKFNAKKEVTKETYLGMKILRFHMKCPRCFGDIIFKTDIENSDFTCESGCVKIHEPTKATTVGDSVLERLQMEELQERLEEEGKKKENIDETAIEQLERRLQEQQKEQQIIDEIEQIQSKQKTLEKLETKKSLQEKQQKDEDDLELEDLKAAREAFESFRNKNKNVSKPLEGNEVLHKEPKVEVINVPVKTASSLQSIVSGYDSSDDSDDNAEEGEKEAAQTSLNFTVKRKVTNLLGMAKKKQKLFP